MMEERSNSGASGSEPMAGGGEAAGQSVDAGEMGETGETLKRKNNLVKSFGYAASGVVQAGSERNFKVDVVAAVVVFAACALLQVPAWGWAVVAMCVGVQLAMETVNTAIEAIVDLASPDIHPLAKRAKDCAAGAALITACASVVVGLIVFVPALLALLGA
ncbi:diacylglycerol kinase family protein [uncultured Slackia sp.]|uniref:diacylglycerol kinase family protein n=1 Tax=uncultured Slackia sp. TaxID=665903 RepID=UPI0025DB7A0D|nr:diacylglycerol kinase family protein [uncultured Slackia sp.]